MCGEEMQTVRTWRSGQSVCAARQHRHVGCFGAFLTYTSTLPVTWAVLPGRTCHTTEG